MAAHDPRGRGPFLLTALCAYLVTIHSAVLLAGVAGHLTLAGVAVVLAGATAVAAGLVARRRADPCPEPLPEMAPPRPPGATAAAFYPVAAALVASLLWAAPHLLDATRLWIWDDYTYHMVYPALWLREHAIRAVAPEHAFTMQAWYPLGASVVATWFMLPFPGSRGDALAWVSLTGPLCAGIFAGGAVELLRRLGCRPWAGAVAVVLFATSHRTMVMASSFSDADLVQAAALFAGFVFATPRAQVEGRRDVTVDGWHAAFLTGIALGIKVAAAVPSAIILSMLALRARASAPTSSARLVEPARIGLVFLGAWLVTAGYWYARNLLRAGNPLYPGRFLVWPGVAFPETTLLEYAQRYGSGKALADAAVVYLNWPALHGALAGMGLVALGGWVGWRRGRLTRPQAYFAIGALAVAGATAILLPVTPYSAGNAMTFRAGFVHWDSMRYVGLLALLGWTALAFLLDAGVGAPSARLATAAVIATACLLTTIGALGRPPLPLVALALLGAAAAQIAASAPLRRAWPARGRALALAMLPLVMAGLALWRHEVKAMATGAAIHRERLFGEAAKVLDGLPRGTRVAVFGDQWTYPLFGGRDHLAPVRLDGDGHVASTPVGDAMTPGALTVAPRPFLSKLHASGIDVVVVLHLPHPGRSPEWPAQHAALQASGHARLLWRDDAAAIWDLRGRPTDPLLLLLGHRRLGRLEADLAVRPIAERLGHGATAATEGDLGPRARVDLVASRVVELHLSIDEVRPIGANADLHGHVGPPRGLVFSSGMIRPPNDSTSPPPGALEWGRRPPASSPAQLHLVADTTHIHLVLEPLDGGPAEIPVHAVDRGRRRCARECHSRGRSGSGRRCRCRSASRRTRHHPAR